VFYFNQFLHNPSNQLVKYFILIRFKGIEANDLYGYKKKFIKNGQSYNYFFTYHSDMKSCDTKEQVITPKKRKKI